MKKYNKLISGIVVNLLILLALTGAFNVKVLAADNVTPLDKAKSLVKEYYIGDISTDTIDEATDLPSLVKSLNDPYSACFTPQQYNDFTGAVNNSFSGIGVSIESSSDGLKILSVFDGSPAKESGLIPGDIITEADGHLLSGLSTEVATSYVRGVTGTQVHIEVERETTNLSFDVTRKSIVLPTVVGKLIDNHIGCISISSFGDKTATEFKNVYEDLKNNSADSYIVDLRNNGGGYMDAALDIAGFFVGDNVVLKSQPKTGQIKNYNGTDQKELIDKPVIFLTNKYSASASEILSAAVKDYKKALFIGEKTYGKGVAQSIFTLPDDNYLKLTIFKFVSPLGNEINKVGITPDLGVKDDAKTGIDSLSAARILFSKLNNSSDKSGLAQITVGEQNYQIDLNVAESEDNINTFKYLSTNLFTNSNFLMGDMNGWKEIPEDQSVNDYLFPPVGVVAEDNSI